jgi:hypothetical protein
VLYSERMQHEIVNVENANNRYGYSVLLKLTCSCGEKWTVRKSTYDGSAALRKHVSGYARAIAVGQVAVATYTRYEEGNS